MIRTTRDTVKDAIFNAPTLNSFILPPQQNPYSTLATAQGKPPADKKTLPGDKFINRANAAEELYILIAHHIDHLGP
ncbi:hypothetical protein BADSM9389_17850 [Buttiauxella agrestis]|nr:hypothetical protein BADSM9389_17850 [Buttiauxella agrestis]